MDLPIALNVIPFLASRNFQFCELFCSNKEHQQPLKKSHEPSIEQSQDPLIESQEPSIESHEPSIKQLKEETSKEEYKRDLFYVGFTVGACVTVSAVVILIYVIPVSWIHRIAQWKKS